LREPVETSIDVLESFIELVVEPLVERQLGMEVLEVLDIVHVV
jgi:hypothetical protein